jgi:hypothetical protein
VFCVLPNQGQQKDRTTEDDQGDSRLSVEQIAKPALLIPYRAGGFRPFDELPEEERAAKVAKASSLSAILGA